jgi:asparagine synthase (glutamine-hydrolysing)
VDVVDAWLRRAGTDDIGRYLLDGSALIYAFLEPHAVQRLAEQHQRGARDNHKLLFSLIVLEQWLRVQSTHSTPAAVEAPVLALSA